MADKEDLFSDTKLRTTKGKKEAMDEITRLATDGRAKELLVANNKAQLRSLAAHPYLGNFVREACSISNFDIALPTATPPKGQKRTWESLVDPLDLLGQGSADPNLQPGKTIEQSKKQKLDAEEAKRAQWVRLLQGKESKSAGEKLKAKKKELEAAGKKKEEIEEEVEKLRGEMIEAEKKAVGWKEEEAKGMGKGKD